jgi:hypothetical protein
MEHPQDRWAAREGERPGSLNDVQEMEDGSVMIEGTGFEQVYIPPRQLYALSAFLYHRMLSMPRGEAE